MKKKSSGKKKNTAKVKVSKSQVKKRRKRIQQPPQHSAMDSLGYYWGGPS